MQGIAEAWGFGFGEPFPVSSEHGLGLDSLYEALLPFYKGPRRKKKKGRGKLLLFSLRLWADPMWANRHF